MDTATKGAMSELKAAAWLLEQGYTVYRNISPTGPIDLIAVNESGSVYIDVKTANVARDWGVKQFSAATKPRPSSEKYKETPVKLLYVYKDQVAWRLYDLRPDWEFD